LKKEKSRKYRLLQVLRILSQWFFFGLFLFLFSRTRFTGEDVIEPVERFFHFDPLLGLATTIAGRAFFAAFAWAGATVLLTVVLGRVVCGWVCPLGGVHQFFSSLFKKARLHKPKAAVSAKPLTWKYFILVFVLTGSLLGLNLAGWLDPLSFLYRSFAAAVFPGLSVAATGLIKLLYALKLGGPAGTLGQVYESLTINPVYGQGFFLGLLFLAAVLLNLVRERFWCRILCPAGALLGLLSAGTVFKLKIDKTRCIDCGLCNLQCQTQAAPYPDEEWKRAECVYCFTCGAVCPTAAVGFPVRDVPRREKRVSLDRRKILWTPIAALAALPLFRIHPGGRRAAAALIRPPGALPEPRFLSTCVKCGECQKACPTGGLQPVLAEAGPEGLWTPRLVPRVGYCEYYCSLCSQVCPTGAIRELSVEEKIKVKIGTAWVDKNRCLPYALGKPCIVCEEHCPTSPKAIRLVENPVTLPGGSISVQKAPVVDYELCIGCGICENKCPVMDQPAIYTTSVGERRSETNRLLLDIEDSGPY
jgi:MauM/NapG family ferredoxin protein